MAIWVQRAPGREVLPLDVRRVALILLPGCGEEGLEPVLNLPVPGVDGVLHAEAGVSGRMLAGPDGVRHLDGYDLGLWLRPGETPLVGLEPTALRAAAVRMPLPALMPVHYPVGAGEITLLGLEPRWIAAAPGGRAFLPVPIESDRPPAADVPAERDDLAWAVLYRALQALTTGDRRQGLQLLDHIYHQVNGKNQNLTALAVRNGLAAALALGERPWQDEWLRRAGPFTDHDELRLLWALVPYVRGDLESAADRLGRVLAAPPGRRDGLISGGGATTYRARTFLGRTLARMGDLNGAVIEWALALRLAPDYLPPLRELARHRIHVDVLNRLELQYYWIGRPRIAAELVATAYARSSAPEQAAPILAARPDVRLPADLRQAVEGSSDRGQRGQRSGGRGKRKQGGDRPGVVWEGPLFTASSLGRVNRELAAHLLALRWDLGGLPTEPDGYRPDRSGRFRTLADRLWHRPAGPAVWVRHHWPPSFVPPPSGRLVVILPWEFGPVPADWLPGIAAAEEIWVYSHWVRRGVIDSGVDPARVHVIPCGIDPEVFRPGHRRGAEEEPFQFLYVGGTIGRKGYDLALDAFLAEFGPDEPVELVVKDFGSDTFYRTASGIAAVREAAAATADCRRRVRVLAEQMTDTDLAALYRQADVLVAPYRAEGFCLPALEAMACGTAVILPALGPALDYAPEGAALLVPAEEVALGSSVGGFALAAPGRACQVSMAELRRAMRWAYGHREETWEMGRRAAAHVHARFTWAHAARTAEARLRHLVTR